MGMKIVATTQACFAKEESVFVTKSGKASGTNNVSSLVHPLREGIGWVIVLMFCKELCVLLLRQSAFAVPGTSPR